jgi:hypothetical protein
MTSPTPDETDRAAARAWCLMVVGFVVLAAIGLGYGAASLSRASMSLAKPGVMSSQTSGAPAEHVVEVTQVMDGVYAGRIAVKAGDVYLRTGEDLKFRVSAGTPFVMGVPADLHVGAIIHVRGVRDDDNGVSADRIVILTPNVTLKDAPPENNTPD